MASVASRSGFGRKLRRSGNQYAAVVTSFPRLSELSVVSGLRHVWTPHPVHTVDRRGHHRDVYSGGWAFPAAPFNWTLYLFCGGNIQEGSCPDSGSRSSSWPR